MDGNANANQILFEPAPELWRRLSFPGQLYFTWLKISPTTGTPLTWSCWRKEIQLRIDLSEGRRLHIHS